jgi:hypothetical protein
VASTAVKIPGVMPETTVVGALPHPPMAHRTSEELVVQ